MLTFKPQRIFFEHDALDYKRGRELYDYFKKQDIPVIVTGSHNRVTGIPGKTSGEMYKEAKNTWVFGVRRGKTFQTCKPSAHYQLPLFTSCPGMCTYCYLNTTLGRKPYLRAYVNVEEILEIAQKYIEERKPEETVFEGAATSDPLPLEPYTGALKEAITFFAQKSRARFRFVTKFDNVDSLFALEHNQKTRIRFSLNSERIIRLFEPRTPPLDARLQAARDIRKAGYPLGLLIAPVFLEEGWEREYRQLFEKIGAILGSEQMEGLTLEIITHRYTLRAKKNITAVFPGTSLPMEEKERQFRYGQFGYGKYVYPKEVIKEAQDFFHSLRHDYLPEAEIDYFI